MRNANIFGLGKAAVCSALILVLVLVWGCGGNDKLNRPFTTNYKTGIGGVELSILSNMPPAQIFEGDNFRIGVKIENKGGYDTKKGELRIMGLSEVWTPMKTYDAVVPPLVGRSIGFDQGDSYIAEFEGKATALPPLASTYTAKFTAVMDYDYETSAYTDLCINPQVVINVKESSASCKVKEKTTLSGQGAPIAVTSVEERILPSEQYTTVEIAFTVEDKGKGELVSSVLVEDVKLANRRMSCTPNTLSPEDLKGKRNKVTCRVVEAIGVPYTTTFSALLHYSYRVQSEGSFEVKSFES